MVRSLETEEKQREALRIISEEFNISVVELEYCWEFWARPKQMIPSGDWFCWLIRSGRGFGKTRTGSETIRKWVNQGYKQIALIGQTKADVRDTMVELGDSSILKTSPPWNMPDYQPSKRRIVWPNGAVATIFSGDEPDQLRGPQYEKAWVDELAKFKYPEETWDNLEMGLRLGDNPQVVVTTTPRPIKIIKELINDPDTVDVKGHTNENINNLSSRFIDRVIEKYEGTRLGRQELEGDILDDNPNALWGRTNIEDNRVTSHPELVAIVIAIDPQATDNENSAETGIIAVGLGVNGLVYVLEDMTVKGSPKEWGSTAVAGYNKYKANLIVGEVNNGGDMVEHVIRTVDNPESNHVAYEDVRASRGKQIRAEPVASLYEQDKVKHVGTFPELEDQLCEWVPGEKSPDRLDALVWGVWKLVIEKQEQEETIIYDDRVNISPF